MGIKIRRMEFGNRSGNWGLKLGIEIRDWGLGFSIGIRIRIGIEN